MTNGPTPLYKRVIAQAAGDYTVNAAGEAGMPPLTPLRACGTVALVDVLVRDGWVRPEDRMAEIAALVQRQRDVMQRELVSAHRACGDLRAENTRLRRVLQRLHDDLLERGLNRVDPETAAPYRQVAVGRTVWLELCAALQHKAGE